MKRKGFVLVFLGLIALMTLVFSCSKECSDADTIQKLEIQLGREKSRLDSLKVVNAQIQQYSDSVNTEVTDAMIDSAIKQSDIEARERLIRENSKCL